MIELAAFFDIETLPTDNADLIADISSLIRPPASMKKPETIAAWTLNEKPGAIIEAVAKTSLDGGLGRVASIAVALGDGEISAATSAGPDGYEVAVEKRLIEAFFARCHGVYTDMGVAPCMIGHNVCNFDVRFLWKRALVLGIRPPFWWPVAAKPWDEEALQDTMVMWEGARGFISQDRLARILGVGGKGDVDGSMVAGLWAEGRYEDIRQYNADDVRCAREIWRRITGHVPKVALSVVESEAVAA